MVTKRRERWVGLCVCVCVCVCWLFTSRVVLSFAIFCSLSLYTPQPAGLYLAQVGDGESEGHAIAGAGVHVVAHQQDDLQQLGERLALAQLLAGRRHRHHVGLDVVQLLLELQPEEDGLETRLQPLHARHLRGWREYNMRQRERVQYETERESTMRQRERVQ